MGLRMHGAGYVLLLQVLLHGFAGLDVSSPPKFLTQTGFPRKPKTYGGKENKVKRLSDTTPAGFAGEEEDGGCGVVRQAGKAVVMAKRRKMMKYIFDGQNQS
ncbi:hypothetical protein OIU76_021304 [Salix suchowensis]|nr:hypothetical protein OIU76_021304 [Salix suchowensis]